MAEVSFEVVEQSAATASFQIDELRASITSARAQAGQIDLPPIFRDLVDGALETAAEEAAKDEPDRRRLAGLLGMATRVVKEASASVTGTSVVLDSLQEAAALVGPLGQTALTLATL